MALTQKEISQLYVALLNRAADAGGVEFWQDQASLAEAAQAMIDSQAGTSFYPEDNRAFIDQIYENTVGLEGQEDADIQYWVDLLASGEYSRGELVAHMVNSIMDPAHEGTAFQESYLNRVAVSEYVAGLELDGELSVEELVAATTFNEAGLGVVRTEADATSATEKAGELEAVDNTSLTEALENLSAAEAGVTGALAAAATAVALAEDPEATEEEIKQVIEGFDKDALEAVIEQAKDQIDVDQAAVDQAISDLFGARAAGADADDGQAKDLLTKVAAYKGDGAFDAEGEAIGDGAIDAKLGLVAGDKLTDANIAKALANAQKAVNADKVMYDAEGDAVSDGEAAKGDDAFTARELQILANTAANAVTADVSAKGTNADLLVELRDAIAALVKAGVDLADEDELTEALTKISKALTPAVLAGKEDADISAVIAAVKDLVDEDSGKSDLNTGNTALDKALNSVADKLVNRDSLQEAADTAADAFEATLTGAILTAAQELQAVRDGQKEAVTQAEQALADTKELISVLESLQDDYEAAVKALEEAQEYFEAEGLELPVSIDGSYTATENSDILLFNVNGEDSAIILGFESDDILFVGKGFTVNVLEAGVDLANERVGDASVLEVFIQQVGNNTVLSFEQEEFAGNQKTGSLTDIVQVTLTGVDAADVSLDADGYISIA